MAKGIFQMLFEQGLKQATRTATRDTVHKKTSGRWECPSCGVMKAAQAIKHPTASGHICTKCNIKVKKDG